MSMLTDDLGRYRIFGLEAGTYLVGADGRGGVTFFEPIEVPRLFVAHGPAGPGTVRHDLPSVGTDRVRGPANPAGSAGRHRHRHFAPARPAAAGVRNPARFPGSAGIDQLLLVRKRGLGMFGDRQFHANDQGRFVLPAVEPGEYRLLVGPGRRLAWPT